MLERVRQGLLDDAVRAVAERCRQGSDVAVDPQVDLQASRSSALDQLLQPLKARARAGVGRQPQDAEHVLQVLEGLAASGLDDEQCVPRERRAAVQLETGGAALHEHQADAVCHHVVQLARDARTLGGEGGLLVHLVPSPQLRLCRREQPLAATGVADAAPDRPCAGQDDQVADGIGDAARVGLDDGVDGRRRQEQAQRNH